jgi:hypothetical protein
LCIALSAVVSGATAATNEELFLRGVQALERGAPGEAIEDFELLADRGFVHPDASVNRAAAYLRRADTPQARIGDLGRAAAALEETLLARADDEEAVAALDRVREEIARRRAKQGAEQVVAQPSLGRALVGLFDEDIWAIGAAFGSVLLGVGLAVRLWIRRATMELAGTLSASIGGVLLVVFGLMAVLSRQMRIEETPAVVIAQEARLLDERGTPVPSGDAIVPEGAGVRVLDTRGNLARILWGSAQGWVVRSQLRTLAR